MAIIFVIKKGYTISGLPSWLFGIMLLLIPIMLSGIALFMTKYLDKESKVENCRDFSLADGQFLPVYLGYFFVAVSIDDLFTMLIVYLILFVFTYISQTQYFNPVFLLLGYHYYHITTELGTRVFVIHKGRVIRNADELVFSNIYRLNDSTFINRGER